MEIADYRFGAALDNEVGGMVRTKEVSGGQTGSGSIDKSSIRSRHQTMTDV